MTTTDEQDKSDSDLLAAVAKADMAAFEALYRLYEKRVYQYAYTFVRDRAAAEEVAVDTMTAVWHGAAGFAGQSRASTWILGIARHKALDAVRKGARQSREVALEEAAQVADASPMPADTIATSQTGQFTRRAMAALTPDHQEILRLVFFEELPYEEIAALLAIPANTVKTRVYYAKQQLKQHLERLARREAEA
ncbi:MAG TPA: sigma-70 family RNA polymerase sigma factor [Steroidobacteraceae bacterium]|jgi:RNA polymerase sigma-70 factor (ECF subfamily)|nr:sigma-70 family RNA polymerase sigma factor [Steroidobacteraceae bacterium]